MPKAFFNPLLPRNLPLVGILTAYAASVIGTMIAGVALPWFVLELTNDAAAAGTVAFVNTIPLIIGTLFGGVYVDRVGRRQASILSDAISSLSVAAIPLIHGFLGIQFWQLLLLTFIGSLLDSSSITARESLLPEVARLARVPLPRLNAITETIQGLSFLIGPAIAGFLIAVIGSVNTLWVTAALSMSAVVVSLLFLPARLGRAIANSSENYLESLKVGLRFIAKDRMIKMLIILFTVLTLAMSPLLSVILPVFVQQKYDNAMNLGLLISAYGIGSILGVVTYGAIGHRASQRWLLVVSILALSFIFGVFAFAPPFHLVLAASAIGGILGSPFNPIVNTVLQQRTPAELRGRILGTVNGISLIAAPMGILIAGLLLEGFGVQVALGAIALLITLIAIWVVFNPIFRTLDKSSLR
ncbi:MAG: MFS transporter [Oculatellaceae cyanobacterium Prado106]|jgi:MFS family permease|nr:MFS transporter [Oculatellaceae cyanobacterium Prado106]